MALELPNLDDKPFSRIAEDARLLIPSTAPEWTDHNVHDPGITFVELFAWLAEIQHYRLNRTAVSSYERFFAMMGLTPLPAQAAEVTVAFELDNLKSSVFIPSNTKLSAIGIESIPFQTIHDQYLTNAKLTKIVTHAGGRETVQTAANGQEDGHFEAFGAEPEIDDFLLLEFEDWFTEPQAQLEITLFEDDLPAPLVPLSDTAPGFHPSAVVSWEYRRESFGDPRLEWEPVEVIKDGTQSLSRSGELIFRVPRGAGAQEFKQLRARLVSGRYEIPPRIVGVRTNTIRGRQVETVVNEALGGGRGSADQFVRLQKAPLFIHPEVGDGPLQAGDVLDWKQLIIRLNNASKYPSPQKEALSYILDELSDEARQIITSKETGNENPNQPDYPSDDEKYQLTQAFNLLLERPDFYRADKFPHVNINQECLAALQDQICRKVKEVRRCNRFLMQTIFRDLFVSDRLEIQTSVPGASGDDEGLTWATWDGVESFEESTPEDYHYILDQDSGTVYFGNGFNGRTPQPSEAIRARFYRYSQLENGNLPAKRFWQIGVTIPEDVEIRIRENFRAAAGGRLKETIEETKSRARAVFRKEAPVLTVKDYENVVKNSPGLRVARVKVLPNFNPKLRCLRMAGDVTVIVEPYPAPRQAFPNAPPAEASKGFLTTIQNNLENRRLITTNIHVMGPSYVRVNVSCRVFLNKRVSESEALERIKKSLAEFFEPILGGPDKGQGWPFGRSVFTSEISQQISRLSGVDYVTNLRINDLPEGAALKLQYNELPASGTHAIQTVSFESRASD